MDRPSLYDVRCFDAADGVLSSETVIALDIREIADTAIMLGMKVDAAKIEFGLHGGDHKYILPKRRAV